MRPPNPFPNPLDDALRDRFRTTDNFVITCKVSDDAIRWWDDRFGRLDLYPRELCDAFSKGLPFDKTFRVTMIDPAANEIRVEFRAFDKFGEQVIFSGRGIELNADQVHLNKTTLREDIQGQTYGRRILGNAFEVMNRLELEKLALTAMMHGPYIWAKAGFLPDAENWAIGYTQSKLLEQLYRLPESEVSYREKAALARLVENGPPSIVRGMARLDKLVTSTVDTSRQVKLGWYLLVEGMATWKGSLYREDIEAVGRLRRYLALGGVVV
ncbi:hypothetical protein ASG60_21590 [Methylobacterium sp. Leaf469]|uniref:hypothetical protein n=1 Tax=Methylobacterium sp. Leaf469 TaxID=1736387 RepID=UPI0006FBD849|nr:hypothetical protein [Methylobacterium sp. Leaf469]KQT89065.1 hypothetical protein ASG60_21590 [Methylobacterium sp. Leaf469]